MSFQSPSGPIVFDLNDPALDALSDDEEDAVSAPPPRRGVLAALCCCCCSRRRAGTARGPSESSSLLAPLPPPATPPTPQLAQPDFSSPFASPPPPPPPPPPSAARLAFAVPPVPMGAIALRASEVARSVGRDVAIWSPAAQRWLLPGPLLTTSADVGPGNTLVLAAATPRGWFTLLDKSSGKYLVAVGPSAKGASRAAWRVSLVSGPPGDSCRFRLIALPSTRVAIGTAHSWGASGGGDAALDMLCVAPDGGVGRTLKRVPGAEFVVVLLGAAGAGAAGYV